MSTSLAQQPLRNDFSFIGLTENYLSENPNYLELYEFEKVDFVPLYWQLHRNLWPALSISGVYLVAIFFLHRWMKNRQPFELRGSLFIWNVFLAGLSMIMFSRILPEMIYINQKYGFYRTYCKLDHVNTATAFWASIYGLSKVAEFMDTVFIILRKQKLTFLHVFHHTSVFVACTYGLIVLDPAARYFALMNTFVHSVMYTYYALKSAQVKLPRKLAMAVTSIQLIQFVLGGTMNALVVYHKAVGTNPSCDRPNDITWYYSGLALFYLFLFGRFFVHSYITKPKSKVKSG